MCLEQHSVSTVTVWSNIPSHKTKQKWLFWKSFVYFIYSSKIWRALLRYQDSINIHLRTPNNHPEEQEMGKDLAECTLNVVHFWTSKKDPILNPRFSSPWYPAENYPSSSTSLDTWHPDADTVYPPNATGWTSGSGCFFVWTTLNSFRRREKNNGPGSSVHQIIQQTFNDL